MFRKIRDRYVRTTLETKIRISYLLIMIPVLAFMIFASVNMLRLNHRYDDLISSVAEASEFSLDFQKDFDMETYLVIVGNKTPEDSDWDELLDHAEGVVEELTAITDNPDNLKTLESVSRYLSNLATYRDRIEENLAAGNLYEDNMQIWENDVQIVTGLVRESMITYIYDETRDLQEARDAYQVFYLRLMQILAVAVVVIIVVLALMSYFLPINITRKLKELCEITDRIAEGDLTVRADVGGGVEVQALSSSMNEMIVKINELIEQTTAEQKRLRKAEFELLQAQINPHFLYNTLDAIMWLAQTGEKEQAVSMVRSLSDYFRTSLNQGRDMVTVREELRHVLSYLEIQKVRYQDILEYEIDVPEALYDFTIPKITIQPLVENALYHGIRNRRGSGWIKVTGRLEGSNYILSVEDNGKGMTEDRLREVENALHEGSADAHIYGVYNVNERIRLNVGEEYGLRFTSTYDEGTKVEVVLPQK